MSTAAAAPTLPSLARRLARWCAQALIPLSLGCTQLAAQAAPPRDRLTLLVPDDANLAGWQVRVWLDTAADEGIRMDVLTNSALLAMGSTAAGRIAGLVVPDSAHLKASAAVVAAIKQYAYTGGQLMLVYDAGVLDERGFFPPSGNSRFADLVGVDYVFWNNGLGASTMVGFGPVVGTKARLESLSLPPGKYLPYVAPGSLSANTNTTAFVPTNQYDPGGSTQMLPLVLERLRKGIEDGSAGVRSRRPTPLRDLLGLGVDNTTGLRFGQRLAWASAARHQHILDVQQRPAAYAAARLNADGDSYTELPYVASAPQDATLQAISGYAYGPLGYFHYVTSGNFPGNVYLSSPEHGLVAGARNYGSGRLLFVNMPLGYFKAIGTDAAPLHGFLNLFARDQVGLMTMSAQPEGRGGLIYNWHIDDGDDLTSNTRRLLASTNILRRGPFSIHLTAGPDVITVGDGNGMNLNGSLLSQDTLRRLSNTGFYGSFLNFDKLPPHAIGSHGGWIHDFWGLYANEANSPDLTHLLQWNFDAIERVTGRKIREYSSPTGTTPLWAVRWLENRGVVASYLVADLGTGMVRSYRNGARLANKLWFSPVAPLGKYATFEEFDQFGINDMTSGQWLLDLQSFVVNRRTNRLFYTHPPGVVGHLNPITTLLDRADALQSAGRFKWYTMTELADFSQRRVETSVNTSFSGNLMTVTATHPSSLTDQTFLLRKDKFGKPNVGSGQGSVSSDATDWIVTVESGTRLVFQTMQR